MFLFFFKQKTAYEMRISDWSSDVCSSDLAKSDKKKHEEVCTKIREDGAFIEAGENDNLIVQKLAANPNTLGFFGYSFLEENGDKVKGIAINGVEPSMESIASFKYPAARPLFVYIKRAHLQAVPGLKEFGADRSEEHTSE